MGYSRKENNSTSYNHPNESNLYDLHKAMQYNALGQPVVRTVGTQAVSYNSAQTTAFGEPIAVPLTPVIQLDALYNFDPREFEQFTFSTGEVESTGTLFKCHTGTGAYGYAVLRSNRIVRYRPGQGVMARFTASFENPQAGATLRAGLFAQEQGLNIGYDGTTFGVLRQNGGKAHIEQLTITTPGAGNITITLNGVAYNIAITGSTAAENAVSISSNSFGGYITEQCDNTVTFLATSLGAQAGVFSYTATSGGSAATFSSVQTGVNDVTNWTYQADFNVDTLDGNGPSGVLLDTTKINIFQIQFRWLGAGIIKYSFENPDNGEMIFFHQELFSNRNTDVHLDNPSFKIGFVAANLSANTGTDSHITGASMMAALEGYKLDSNYSTAGSNVLTTLTNNTIHNILTVKNRLIYQNKINLREAILKKISLAYQGNDPLIVYLFLDGTKSTPHEYYKIADYSCCILDKDEGIYTSANEHPLAEFVLPINGSAILDINELEVRIPPGSAINIAVSSTQNISRISCAAIWTEI